MVVALFTIFVFPGNYACIYGKSLSINITKFLEKLYIILLKFIIIFGILWEFYCVTFKFKFGSFKTFGKLKKMKWPLKAHS